jgi:1,2-diacylglycerol 3-alpha-glucosyltransferase
MKVAFFTDTYYPQTNGVVKSIDICSKKLRERGHEVHIFCPEGAKKDKYTHTVPASRFRNYPEYRVGMPNMSIIEEVRKIRPDVIHVHSPFTVGLMGMSIARILGIPTVSTYHTMISEYLSYAGSSAFKDVADSYSKFFFGRSSVIIVPSGPIEKMFKGYRLKRPIRVLPTPLEIGIVKRKDRGNKAFTILHVGRLCAEKRIDFVLRAFENFRNITDSKLIITSDGPDRKRLEGACKSLGIEDDVTFTGYVSDRELIRLYSTADAFVSASDTETQGLVVLEAMACGCPVVVRNALGFKDFVEDRRNGMLFGTEEELIGGLEALREDQTLRRRIVAGGDSTVKKFDASKYAESIESIYKESIHATGPSKTSSKMMYASFMIFGSICGFIIKRLDIPINSRFLGLFVALFKMSSALEILKKRP